MQIRLSDHFTAPKLLRFVLPSVIMMVFSSIYGVVDGIFVSNFAGATAFAAINFILPYVMVFSTLGFMIGTGGSALVAMVMGQGKPQKANAIFSQLVYVAIAGGIFFTVFGMVTLRPVAIWLGASEDMLPYCVNYGTIVLLGITPFMLQNAFQSLLITAEKPNLGLGITVLSGCTNMVLDALLVGVLKWGVQGAAIATVMSQIVGGVIPLIYFFLPNKSRLRLGKPDRNFSYLGKACLNGSSEFMTNVSMSLVNMLYNYQLMRIAGENGVAAYGVIMYVNFVFLSILIGYAVGSAPIVSYHYGAGNTDELKNMFRKSLALVGIMAVFITALALLMARPFSMIFVSYDADLLAMTVRAFRLYCLSYLFAGFNIFGSSFFTALNNGLISALISFLRTLLFQVVCVLALPLLFDLDGIWLAITAAEALAVVVTLICFVRCRSRYHYA